jgi:Rrf2 family iron-sulfur cluster assembly transcriptional regulator
MGRKAPGAKARFVAQAACDAREFCAREIRERTPSMRLSTKGRYAVMAMADLAKRGEGRAVTLGEIATRQDISLAYLEQLFSRLRKRGLVKSVRGPGGGYQLAQPAADLPIADIIVAVDEPLKAVRCSSGSLGCMPGGERCLTHDLWDDLGHHIYDYLAGVSLDDVVSGRLKAKRAQPSAGAAA